MPSPFYNLCGALSAPVLKGVFRLHATGVDRVPHDGGLVLAANHNSNLDPWPLAFPFWPRRQLFFMAKSELFNPILGPPLRAGGAFPVRRGEADMESIEHAIEICRNGGIVAMFPEGTRRSKGLRKKFAHRPRTGAARIALSAGVPLVPAALDGTDRITRMPKLKVAYGDPIPVDDLDGLAPRAAYQEATDRLMERIYVLLEEL